MKNQRIDSPIDFVIAWVDGNDPEWKKEKAQYEPLTADGDQREVRFRDWNNLKYWFRAVETYAPWVHGIYFITWGHVPSWLNLQHPKLHIVNHRDYIPPEYLPTFNSHTIELNLHRIPGLSEQFVYFNDDMFLNGTVHPTDFFKKGLPRDMFAQNAIYFGQDCVGSINGNDMCIINTHFPKKKALFAHWKKWFSPVNGFKSLIRTFLLLPWPWFPGFLYTHTSTNLLKSTLKTVWELEGETLDSTCKCRFRHPTNVNQWLFKYWQLASGKFIPISGKKSHCYHIKDSVDEACRSIRAQKFKIICINDTARTEHFEILAAQIQEAFESTLPSKSSYEY